MRGSHLAVGCDARWAERVINIMCRSAGRIGAEKNFKKCLTAKTKTVEYAALVLGLDVALKQA